MNFLVFFGIVMPTFLNVVFQAQNDLVSYLQNPTERLGALSSFGVAVEPVKNPRFVSPVLRARSVVLMDKDSGKLLYTKNAEAKLPIASLTKIMTAILVLEKAEDLNEPIAVPAEALSVGGSTMHLHSGEIVSVRNLLKGLLIESGNDAAITLARHFGGTTKEFVKEMNDKAKAFGFENTHFANPHGYDSANHYSTAIEMAKLTKIALSDPEFASIVTIKKSTVTDITGKIEHKLDNTNELLGSYLNIIGVKTGTTSLAGESVISSAVGEQGQIVIAVLLNSPDRFQEAKSALDWSLRAYSWLTPLDK